jgi:hypothetical protein
MCQTDVNNKFVTQPAYPDIEIIAIDRSELRIVLGDSLLLKDPLANVNVLDTMNKPRLPALIPPCCFAQSKAPGKRSKGMHTNGRQYLAESFLHTKFACISPFRVFQFDETANGPNRCFAIREPLLLSPKRSGDCWYITSKARKRVALANIVEPAPQTHTTDHQHIRCSCKDAQVREEQARFSGRDHSPSCGKHARLLYGQMFVFTCARELSMHLSPIISRLLQFDLAIHDHVTLVRISVQLALFMVFYLESLFLCLGLLQFVLKDVHLLLVLGQSRHWSLRVLSLPKPARQPWSQFQPECTQI